MRRVSIVLIAFSFPAFAQNFPPYVVRDSVSNCVNVRVDYDDSSSSIACLVAGTPVTVVDVIPYWREITFGTESRGWIARKFIEPAISPPVVPDTSIPADAFLDIHFVDVGQGDAIWIQTHDDGIDGNGRFEGHSIVIDGGPYSSDIENPFRGYIEDVGHHGAVIEALIVTHPHTDHYRGVETISRHIKIRHYYDPGYPSDKSGYLSFLAAMRGTESAPPRAETMHIGVDNFGVPDWGSELDAEFLYAWPGSIRDWDREVPRRTTPQLSCGSSTVSIRSCSWVMLRAKTEATPPIPRDTSRKSCLTTSPIDSKQRC